MVDLNQHGSGSEFSSKSFGHTGGEGTSFGGADPARRLAIGAVFETFVDTEQFPHFVPSVSDVRAALLDAVMRNH